MWFGSTTASRPWHRSQGLVQDPERVDVALDRLHDPVGDQPSPAQARTDLIKECSRAHAWRARIRMGRDEDDSPVSGHLVVEVRVSSASMERPGRRGGVTVVEVETPGTGEQHGRLATLAVPSGRGVSQTYSRLSSPRCRHARRGVTLEKLVPRADRAVHVLPVYSFEAAPCREVGYSVIGGAPPDSISAHVGPVIASQTQPTPSSAGSTGVEPARFSERGGLRRARRQRSRHTIPAHPVRPARNAAAEPQHRAGPVSPDDHVPPGCHDLACPGRTGRGDPRHVYRIGRMSTRCGR